jgi:membrane protease YdiL (CAAX protease family)
VLLALGGIHFFNLPIRFEVSAIAILQGLIGFVALTLWTFGVQFGYRLYKGKAYADLITWSLAKYFQSSSWLQAVLGGVVASCGEEFFFRGFIAEKWGPVVSALVFGLLHWGPRDIRIVSYWAPAQGFIIALVYYWTGNLLCPLIAHGLFDFGAMLFFKTLKKPESVN